VNAALLDKLRALVGIDHVLTGINLSPFVVEGRTPEAAVFPGSLQDVRAVVALAAEASTAITPWGGGTAAGVGMPIAWSGLVLGLSRLNRIVEHEPGDLTVTVEAGLSLSALQTSLRSRGQWLSIDPPDADRATLGGVIAANASGPRRHLYGTARDLLIGVTVVTADGAIVHGGGKVVKNVAGYDLPKLFIGSYGTLGVIVDMTLKLRPVPDHERFVAVAFGAMKDAGSCVRAVMASDLIPVALDLLDVDAARALALAGPALVVGFDGLPEQVDWQCGELARLSGGFGGRDLGALAPEIIARLGIAAREAFPRPASVMRLSVLPTHVADTIEQSASAARGRGFVSAWAAHAGVGVVTGALASTGVEDTGRVVAALGDWRGIAQANGGFATLESAPLAVKAAMPVWDDLGGAGRLMKRIKEQLDPRNILNPGRFVGGI